MVTDQILVEWEITLKCNYKCSYCCSTNTRPTEYRPNSAGQAPPVLDKNQIREFIQMLGETYPGIEIFVFGGEPFVHPRIEYIIETFNEYNIPFVIQTNLSKHSTKIMNRIDAPFTLQVSIHPTEVKLEDVEIPLDADIREINPGTFLDKLTSRGQGNVPSREDADLILIAAWPEGVLCRRHE